MNEFARVLWEFARRVNYRNGDLVGALADLDGEDRGRIEGIATVILTTPNAGQLSP